ncbi:MAG: hypothetical protein OEZ39_00840 [Gammaproteobacteria bacterium]|nr:hypothetical protein [Gammaproteobacteria bacterium]MDH5650396.1 hypothetical protein [Gammaproteobacteria bacterium]
MDYQIRRKKSELDSTGYMEIGPGKYAGKHWQEGFLFVWEDAFGMAEGVVLKYFNSYDHFGMNEIPKDTGVLISAEWRKAADNLPAADASEYPSLLNLDAAYRSNLEAEVSGNKQSISQLLIELADSLDEFYKTEDWVCILGM